MPSGRVFEDFVPVADDEALVTTGHTLRTLDTIERVRFHVEHDRVVLGETLETLASGRYLRLGGLFDGRLVYSDGNWIYGFRDWPIRGHQPFVREGTLFCTDNEPRQVIFCHTGDARFAFVSGFGEMIQIGNPCATQEFLYFEARDTDDPARPDAWQIYRYKPGRAPEAVCQGANPAVWKGTLYYGVWNGRSFDYRRTSTH